MQVSEGLLGGGEDAGVLWQAMGKLSQRLHGGLLQGPRIYTTCASSRTLQVQRKNTPHHKTAAGMGMCWQEWGGMGAASSMEQ